VSVSSARCAENSLYLVLDRPTKITTLLLGRIANESEDKNQECAVLNSRAVGGQGRVMHAFAAGRSGVATTPPDELARSEGITMKSFCLTYLTVCLLVGTIHAQSISSTQFGFHQDHMSSTPPIEPTADIGFGTFRTWDSIDCCRWDQMETLQTIPPTYDYSKADAILNQLHLAGINDVLMTFGVGVPTFYSNNTDMDCAYKPGICDPPTDVSSDGTGTDAHWIAFLQDAVHHFHTLGSQYARVVYYELFNEFDRSNKLQNGGCQPHSGNMEGNCQFQGTFSQLLRMQEDARCVIQDVGTIHRGLNPVSCANSGINPKGVDTTATVIAGNVEGADANTQRVVLQNFLYCNASPPTNSQCNWGANNSKSNWGALADPVIVLHYYFANVSPAIPELVINRIYLQRKNLQMPELTKPYFAGEGSWLGNDTQTDAGLSAGFTARWWLSLLLAQNFATVNPGPIRGYWYNWDGGDNPGNNPVGIGGLWSSSPTPFGFNPPTSYLSCETAENSGHICTGGTAAKQIISWLVGRMWVSASCPNNNCTNPPQGVFKIDISAANGYQAEIAWDSTVHTQECSSYAHPEVCGDTGYMAPNYVVDYRDLAGGTHASVPTVIGAEPIIAEGTTNTQ
jgi:hypothetical protein